MVRAHQRACRVQGGDGAQERDLATFWRHAIGLAAVHEPTRLLETTSLLVESTTSIESSV